MPVELHEVRIGPLTVNAADDEWVIQKLDEIRRSPKPPTVRQVPVHVQTPSGKKVV